MAQTQRLQWIDAQIRGGRFPNPDSLREAFGISRRRAYDDYRCLRDQLSAPIMWDRERRGWTYSDPTFALPALVLSDGEAATVHRLLLAGREHLAPSAAEGLDAFADWLRPYLSARPAALAESAGGGQHLSDSVSVPSDLVQACSRAIRRRRRLHLRYHGAHRGEVTERTVRPYHLHHWRSEPYLLAWCELRQDWRTFFLGRVEQWHEHGEEAAFARDPDFDPQALLAQGFDLLHGTELVTVRVRFSPYQSRWIRERRYHPSQQNEEQPDGSLVLTLRVAGTEEIKRWLLGYGAHAEVLEPTSLRDAVAEEAKKVAEIYRA